MSSILTVPRKSNHALLQSQRELLSGDGGIAGSFSIQDELAVPSSSREVSIASPTAYAITDIRI